MTEAEKVVEEVIAEPVEDPPEKEVAEVASEVEDKNHDGIPDRVAALESRVDDIFGRIQSPPEEHEIEAPGHDKVVKDESPHKKPWHKRGIR